MRPFSLEYSPAAGSSPSDVFSCAEYFEVAVIALFDVTSVPSILNSTFVASVSAVLLLFSIVSYSDFAAVPVISLSKKFSNCALNYCIANWSIPVSLTVFAACL